MGSISQNDAYIFWGVFTPLFFSLCALSSKFALCSELAPGSESAPLFVSLLFFARSCCLFACFSSFLWLDSTFSWFYLVVLILCVLLRQEIAFGVQRRIASPEVLLLSLFLFYVLNKILRIGNAVQYEISPIVFSDNYRGFYVTYLKYYIKFQIMSHFFSELGNPREKEIFRKKF